VNPTESTMPVNQSALINLIRMGLANGNPDGVIGIVDTWTRQAVERVAELENRVRELEAERAGLRAALEQYANPGYYGFLLDRVGRQTDPTGKARAALAGPIPAPTEATR
jgi:hypothetical protein